jgi:hypothetical protein
MKQLDDFFNQFNANYNDFEAIDELLEEYKSLMDTLDEYEDDKHELLSDIKKRHKELKEDYQKSNKTNSANIDESFLFRYDFSKYKLHLSKIESLNTDNLPYPIFLRDFIIPNFHPLPHPEIQNPIVASICLINPTALPPLGDDNAKEVPLTSVYIQGASGSGKSQLAHLIEKHYPRERICSIKGSDTGASMLRKMHNACFAHLDEHNQVWLYPALAVFENFYLKNMERWKDWSVELLATERQYAMASREGQDGGTFYTFLLKVFTSVEYLQPTEQKNSELYRRTMRIFTEKDSPRYVVSRYDWGYSLQQYKQLWHSDNIDDFFAVLSQVAGKADNESVIPPEFYPPSQIIIATGVYAGIWDSIEEAEECLSQYWKMVKKLENKRGKPYLEHFDNAIELYYAYYRELSNREDFTDKQADDASSIEYLDADKILDEAVETFGKFYSRSHIAESLQSYMESKGFIYVSERGKGIFRRY